MPHRFQRSSWANSDITSRHELDRPSPSTALDRTSAERSYEPDSNARTQLQQLQIDNLFRDHMAAGTTQESHHARRVRNARASQRFRERAAYREFQREMPIPLGATVPSASLDNQKGRPEPLESEDMKLDCECKICFGQIADTLLLPCSHLVICQVSKALRGYPATVLRLFRGLVVCRPDWCQVKRSAW